MVDFWKVIGVYRSLIDNYGALEIWGAGAVVPTCAMQYTGLTESLGLGHWVFYPALKATFGIGWKDASRQPLRYCWSFQPVPNGFTSFSQTMFHFNC